MIREIQIENYKSLQELKLEVGRFNVLIGENGCGKSNLLEAMALAAAAEAGKLDNEFLTSRGIRVTAPELMRSAFEEKSDQKPVKIFIRYLQIDDILGYTLNNDNQPYSKWEWKEFLNIKNEFGQIFTRAENIKEELNDEINKADKEKLLQFRTILSTTIKEAKEYLKYLKIDLHVDNAKILRSFIIYSPENTALRNFYKEGQIEPLGINGEGLLKLLSVIKNQAAETGNSSKLDEIHQSLQLLDWYSDIEIPSDLSASEDKVKIKDRYLTAAFDQRSANEGFLFILFYITLMVADETPKIFAIDNIDASLNPKLCTKLIKELIRLAEKYDKQVFVTGHNPAILDGIDLDDDEQRLFVLSRNKQGHTRCKRITVQEKPKSSTGEPLKLSEAFLRGYLGGLPKGF